MPTNQPLQYYQHSGKAPLVGIVGGLVVGGVAAAIGAVIYAYGVHYIPLIYIRVILTIAFGTLLGIIPARVMRAGNVRNPGIIIGISMAVTLGAYYLSWVAWLYAIFAHFGRPLSFIGLLLRPRVIWFFGRIINRHGTWGMMGSENFSGVELTAIWIVEAAIIFFCALAAARATSSLPFCEACQRWCGPATNFLDTSPTDIGALRGQLESGQMEFARTLPRFRSNLGRYLQWDYHQCPACKSFTTLTVTDITATRQKNGKISRRKQVKIRQLIIGPHDLQQLRPQVIQADDPQAAVPSAIMGVGDGVVIPVEVASAPVPAPIAVNPAAPYIAPPQAPSAPTAPPRDSLLDL